MKSPFPGMDPYLEQRWRDVHTSWMVYARTQLNDQLPPDLQALVEESLDVSLDDDRLGSRFPDVRFPDVRVVEEPSAMFTEPSEFAGGIAVAEPVVVLQADDPPVQRHIEIIDGASGGRVITAIELLSPGNKIGRNGRNAYTRKQREYVDAGINLVEIDFIRQGEHVMSVPWPLIPPGLRSPYLICVRRAEQVLQFELFHAPLRRPLPNIPIPLRPNDKDVVLQLQPLIDACYRGGRHQKINYQEEPVPQFDPDDAAWADRLLREHGRRK